LILFEPRKKKRKSTISRPRVKSGWCPLVGGNAEGRLKGWGKKPGEGFGKGGERSPKSVKRSISHTTLRV